MTHRLYINEYNEEFVHQLSNNNIKGLYATDKSTNDVIVVSGELSDLQKLASLMYADEAKCKEVFPSFQTKDEAEEMVNAEYGKVADVIGDTLFKIYRDNHTRLDIWNIEGYKKLYELYNVIDEK